MMKSARISRRERNRFGTWAKDLRENLKMTQKEFALVMLGYPDSDHARITVSRVERGVVQLHPATRTLYRVIAKHPKMVQSVVKEG